MLARALAAVCESSIYVVVDGAGRPVRAAMCTLKVIVYSFCPTPLWTWSTILWTRICSVRLPGIRIVGTMDQLAPLQIDYIRSDTRTANAAACRVHIHWNVCVPLWLCVLMMIIYEVENRACEQRCDNSARQ